MRYKFADFSLDTDRCLLTRGDDVIELRPKSFDLLKALAERAGSVVEKDALLDEVWPDVTVQETSLTQCVAQLRRCLGAEGSALIRTVPRRGYMLESSVQRVEPRPFGEGLAAKSIAAAVIWLAAGAGLATAIHLAGSRQIPEQRLLLDASATTLGQPLDWPLGRPRIVAGITTLQPGEASEWHSHDAPLLAVILAGEVIVDYGPDGERRYSAGDALLEAIGTPHQARSTGGDWAEILYVLIGEDGSRLRTAAAGPRQD